MNIPIIKVQCISTGRIYALADTANEILKIEENTINVAEGYRLLGIESMSLTRLLKCYKNSKAEQLLNIDLASTVDKIISSFNIVEQEINSYEQSSIIENFETVFNNEVVNKLVWDNLVKETTSLARQYVKFQYGLLANKTIENENWHQGYPTLGLSLLEILIDYFSATSLEEKGKCEQKFYNLKESSVLDMEESKHE